MHIAKHWKLCIALSSLFAFFPTGTGLQACYSSSEREELRYMLFNPDVLNNKAWWSFFYSARLHSLDGRFGSTSDEDALTAEWIAAAGGHADTTAAWNCFFASPSDSLLETNSFYQVLKQKPALLRYFRLARQAEKLATITSSWEPASSDFEAYKTTVDEALASLRTENDPFLKRRYAFQLVKLGYYFGQWHMLDSIYTRHFGHGDKADALHWWAMHYKAKTLGGEKLDSSNYLHALVFSHSSNKMLASQRSYSNHNFEKVLALAQNNNERADIYLLRESINPGPSLQGIKKVYEFSPRHVHLPLLVGREINKLEDWLGTTHYVGATVSTRDYWSERPVLENTARDRKYVDKFTNTLAQMSALESTHPDFYNLAMANLNLLQGNGAGASRHIEKIGAHNPAAAYQATVLRIVLATLQNDITKPDVQEHIGTLYRTLLEKRGDQFESQKILYSLSTYLRHAFTRKGMVGLAGLFDNYAINKFCYTCITYGTFEYTMIGYLDRYASVGDLEALISTYQRKDKNSLEETLLKPYSNPYYFYDLLATKYLRKGDAKKAQAVLQKVPDNFWLTYTNALSNLDVDPFVANAALLTGHIMTASSKRGIVERLNALEEEAKADASRRARNYFQLGNAWYNFTENSWFMLSYGRGSATPDESVYRIGYRKAREYYSKALEHEKDAEQRAKILYMLTVLADSKSKKALYARAYEKYENTMFYNRRNCEITYAMK